MLRGRDIVCVSSLDWDAHWTSKQQIMQRLSASNRILYVEEPVTMLAPLRVPERWKRWGDIPLRIRRRNAGLWTLTPPPLLPFGNLRPEVNGVNQAILSQYLRRAMDRLGFERFLLWTYLPGSARLLDRLDGGRIEGVVYHCVDEHSAFPGFVNPEVVQGYDAELTRRADLVLTTAESLRAAREGLNPNTYHVPNAADVTLFGRAADPATQVPDDLARIPRPRVGVIGVHDERLDVEAILALARARPERQLVLVGPVRPADVDEARLRAPSNVHLLGGKPLHLLPGYLKGLDVALIPYRLNELTRNIFPLKIYEYLAGGVPVVASALPELVRLDLAELAYLAHSPEEYPELVERALAEDRPELRAARQEAARANTWEARVEEISRLVEEHVPAPAGVAGSGGGDGAERLRILLPTIRDPGQIGGTTTHLDMLTKGLAELGHEPRVLYLGAAVPGALKRGGIEMAAALLNRMRRGWGMAYAAVVRARALAALAERELRRSDWDVLNAQEVYSVPALRRVADRHGVPLVLTLHGYPLYESMSEGYTAESVFGRRFLQRAELRALRLADAVVTVDTRLRRHVVRLVPEREERTRALMNFVDTSAFAGGAAQDPGDGVAGGATAEGAVDGAADKEELRRRWGIPQDRVVLLCPRRLVKKNGVVYPALALAGMPAEERKRFLLLHAGEGGERVAIEEIVRKRGLEGEVRLLGGQDRSAMLELYRLSDIVLVPSVHSEKVEEATSLAALEAMASGRPLIAGDVGGLAEMVVCGENGLLVPGGDAEELGAAIRRLAADRPLAERLAERARSYVVEQHSHLRAAEEYAAIYRAAIYRETGPKAEGSGRPVAPRASGPVVSVLGFPVHAVDLEGAARWLLAGGADGVRVGVAMNPERVVRGLRDPRVAEAVLSTDLRFPDGVGMVWALRWMGMRQQKRVPGIELAEEILTLAAADGLPVFFLGGRPGVAEEAAARQREANPGLQVAGTHHGYFVEEEEEQVVAAVRASGARVLLAALGSPRQEVFLCRHRRTLGVAAALGVGGSFDVWTGRVRRAPAPFRRAGLEWLYRLLREPRRLGRQLSLPEFVLRVLAGADDDYGPGRAL